MGTIAHPHSATDVAELARAAHDIVVVGGGIYGAMLHLEAARAGLRSVLVERGDFGGATSENSLRIVHGGLRYLQNLNVARSVESTRERQWYLEAMPRLVTPLPCLLPIYERGRKRTSVLSLGLAANDAISAAIMYLDCAVDVPRGHVLDARATLELAPAIPADGLVGGAVWHDLSLRCPGRVIVEALKWAADFGGVAVNYVEARRLLTTRGRVRGVSVGEPGGHTLAELKANVVVNAAGPWAGALANRWGAADDRLVPLVVAWNVLLDRPPLSGHAVALQDPSSSNAPLKFATSLGGRLLVGTGYASLLGNCESAEAIAESELGVFLSALNHCVPGLDASRRDVLRVFSGVLPAAAPASCVPRARNLLSARGAQGLFTVSGTKFTTARSAARRALSAIRRAGVVRWPATAPQAYPPCHASAAEGLFSNDWTMHDVDERRTGLAHIVAHEAVEHLDDLVLRRTTLGDQPVRALTAARALCTLDDRWQKDAEREMARLAAQLGWRQAARAMNRPGHDGRAAMTA